MPWRSFQRAPSMAMYALHAPTSLSLHSIIKQGMDLKKIISFLSLSVLSEFLTFLLREKIAKIISEINNK